MPRCYLLTVCSGSSLDRYSNNVTLFNLVEQINLRPGAHPPQGTLIPVEVHAYFELLQHEIGLDFDVRFALVALPTGLESYSDVFSHRSTTPRYRTRAVGLPLSPLPGPHEVRVEWQTSGSDAWHRESTAWPLTIAELETRQGRVTH